MFWWIVLVAVLVVGALALWSNGHQRGVNHEAIQQRRKIDYGRRRGTDHGGGGA